MASLRFSYDGNRKQQAGKTYGPSFPRDNRLFYPSAQSLPANAVFRGPNSGSEVEETVALKKSVENAVPNVVEGAEQHQAMPEQVENEADKTQTEHKQSEKVQADKDQADKDQANKDQANKDQANKDQANKDQADKDQADKDQTPQEPVLSISEQYMAKLEQAEGALLKTNSMADQAKISFDELLFQMDNILQVIAIIEASENKRLAGPQLASASLKTEKDNIDHFLELLQNPALQVFMRQALISLMVRK